MAIPRTVNAGGRFEFEHGGPNFGKCKYAAPTELMPLHYTLLPV
jgi:hypothetical protein